MPTPTRLEDGRVAQHWTIDEAAALDRERRQKFDEMIRANVARRRSLFGRCPGALTLYSVIRWLRMGRK